MRYFANTLALLLLVVLVFTAVGCNSAVTTTDKDGWSDLFDGETFKDFKQLGGKAIYTVKDGAIVGTSVVGTKNSFLCTKKRYGDFILELEVQVDPKLNSGIQIRSNSLKEYRDGLVHGYQVEIDPSERAFSGGIYDEARRGWLNDLKDNEAGRKAFKNNQWNHYRIECIGDSMKTWINGVGCADLVDSMTLDGFFGFQVHSTKNPQPLSVKWRNIKIKDLGRHVWKPIFDGKTFNGWHKWGGGNWQIKDGVIIGGSTVDEQKYGLLISDDIYDDFTIRFKFKAVKGNSGFYFRMEMIDHSVGFAGLQAEIDPVNNVGGLYDTVGRGWIIKPDLEKIKKHFKPREWNEMVVSAHGGRIVVHVNGHKFSELKDDPGRARGYLALQLHAKENVDVMFRDLEKLVPEK